MRRLVSSAALAALVFAAAAGTGIAQEGPDEVAPPAHDVYGTVLGVRGDTLSLQLRTGRTLDVDLLEFVWQQQGRPSLRGRVWSAMLFREAVRGMTRDTRDRVVQMLLWLRHNGAFGRLNRFTRRASPRFYAKMMRMPTHRMALRKRAPGVERRVARAIHTTT